MKAASSIWATFGLLGLTLWKHYWLCPQPWEEKLSKNNRICLSSFDPSGNWKSERLRMEGLLRTHQWSRPALSGPLPNSQTQCQTTSLCSLSKMLPVFIQPLSILPKVDSTQRWAKGNQMLIHRVGSDMATHPSLLMPEDFCAASFMLTGARYLAKYGNNIYRGTEEMFTLLCASQKQQWRPLLKRTGSDPYWLRTGSQLSLFLWNSEHVLYALWFSYQSVQWNVMPVLSQRGVRRTRSHRSKESGILLNHIRLNKW